MFKKLFVLMLATGLIIFQSCSGDDETVAGSTCDGTVDCAGECNGSAVADECGVCGGDGIAEGTCDCDGNVGTVDNCGTCDNNSANDCNLCDFLPANSMHISPTGQLWYNTTENIAGLQFTLQGSSFNSIDYTILGSDVPAGLTPTVGLSSGVVLAISLTGDYIPPGCDAAYQFDIADPSAITGLGGQNVFIVSSTTGTDLGFTYYTGE